MRQQHMMAAQQCLALVLPEGRKAAGVKPAFSEICVSLNVLQSLTRSPNAVKQTLA